MIIVNCIYVYTRNYTPVVNKDDNHTIDCGWIAYLCSIVGDDSMMHNKSKWIRYFLYVENICLCDWRGRSIGHQALYYIIQ